MIVLFATFHHRTMRSISIALIVLGATALSSPLASAVTCYQVIDANDNVIYRDIFPPVDLSEQGDAERKAMRARNEHMIAMETDKCPRLELVAGAGVGGRINLEEMGDLPSGITLRSGSETRAAPAPKAPATKPAPSKPAAKPATTN